MAEAMAGDQANDDQLEIANQMNSDRLLNLQKRQSADNQMKNKKKEDAGQALGSALSKSGWGMAILTGVKWIIKAINLIAGEMGVAFFVTTWIVWIVTLPLHFLIDMVPVLGTLITWGFCMILAIPLSSSIYPKVKPYVDGILKGTSLTSGLSPIKK